MALSGISRMTEYTHYHRTFFNAAGTCSIFRHIVPNQSTKNNGSFHSDVIIFLSLILSLYIITSTVRAAVIVFKGLLNRKQLKEFILELCFWSLFLCNILSLLFITIPFAFALLCFVWHNHYDY